MLLQFQFSNFRSFKKNTVLDMRASGSNEYKNHIREEGVDKILPITAIYGANASGKSNVFRALSDMCFYILVSFAFDDQFSSDKKNLAWKMLQSSFPYEPHFFQTDKPCSYEVYFTMLYDRRIQYFKYGFVIDEKGICEEWLGKAYKTDIEKKKPYSMIFERKRGTKILLDKTIEKYRENIELSLQKRVLLLSLGAKLMIDIIRTTFKWFTKFVLLGANERQNLMLLDNLAQRIFNDKSLKECVLKYIQAFDGSISGIRVVKELPIREESNYHIYLIHKEESGRKSEIPIEDESAGTIKMILLYQNIHDSLKNGSVFLADELDIKLHPLLMRNIIINFADPIKNPHNAQLIFTTHNTIYMDMGLLRRDEIWFTEKENNVSELYSLDDIEDSNGNKIRKDANYAKNYLLGKYGAIPNLYELMGENGHEQE